MLEKGFLVNMKIGHIDLSWSSTMALKKNDLTLKDVKERNLIKSINEMETALYWLREVKLIILRIKDIEEDDIYSDRFDY